MARHVNAKPIDSEPVEDMRELGITCRDGTHAFDCAQAMLGWTEALTARLMSSLTQSSHSNVCMG